MEKYIIEPLNMSVAEEQVKKELGEEGLNKFMEGYWDYLK